MEISRSRRGFLSQSSTCSPTSKWFPIPTTSGLWLTIQVNCLHEIFFDAALADAQKLDDYYAVHKKPLGPLHGLPVSLKDQFHVKDVETTMGYIGVCGIHRVSSSSKFRAMISSTIATSLTTWFWYLTAYICLPLVTLKLNNYSGSVLLKVK